MGQLGGGEEEVIGSRDCNLVPYDGAQTLHSPSP